jgi:hypothetical protein
MEAMNRQADSRGAFVSWMLEPKSILLGFALLQVLVLFVYEAWIQEYMMHAYLVGTRDSLILLTAAAALSISRPWAYLVAMLPSGFMALELYHRMDGYWAFVLAHIPQMLVQFVFALIVFSYAASCILLSGSRKRALS